MNKTIRLKLHRLVFPCRAAKIIESPFANVGEATRIYYQLDETPGNGFVFYVGRAASFDANYTHPLDNHSAYIECLFHGIAKENGLQYMYIGDENASPNRGIHYPDSQELIDIMTAIQELEQEYCWKSESSSSAL